MEDSVMDTVNLTLQILRDRTPITSLKVVVSQGYQTYMSAYTDSSGVVTVRVPKGERVNVYLPVYSVNNYLYSNWVFTSNTRASFDVVREGIR